MPAPASYRIPGQARPVSRESAVESLGVGWRVQVRPFRNKARTMLAWLEIERPSGEITTGHKVMIDTVDQDESDREIESAAETNQRFRLVDDHPH